ncbi:MAG: hypothetical protein DRJ07_17160, partial [Bacteroidetes bacterium]
MKKITFLLLFLVSTMSVFAQVNVTGVVISEEDGQPIPDVNILVKGTATGTTTDFDGNYSISVPENG